MMKLYVVNNITYTESFIYGEYFAVYIIHTLVCDTILLWIRWGFHYLIVEEIKIKEIIYLPQS